MKNKQRLVLVPRYMSSFVCTGSECEDTCCKGWQVNVDKATYKKYKKVSHPELKPMLEENIKRIRTNPNDEDYAQIILDKEKGCPMLSEEGLCKVQLTLGEDYLSNVCLTYPRITNEINGVLEKSATTSCPEIARLALLNPDGIEFDEIVEQDTRKIVSKRIHTKMKTEGIVKYLWELRIFTIQVLQNRNFPLTYRLILLGMFYKKVHEYEEEQRINELPDLIASYSRMIAEGSFIESFTKIPTRVEVQLRILKQLVDYRQATVISSKRYLECLSAFLQGIEYKPEDSLDTVTERYQTAYQKYYEPFMIQHEYVLENYLVNYVYKNVFPISLDRNVFEEYVVLVLHYGLIKMHLIGMAGFYKEEFSLDHVVKLIQSFGRTIEHNPIYLGQIFELLKEHNHTTMASMAVFIKN
jgi:lysine-N-methylase